MHFVVNQEDLRLSKELLQKLNSGFNQINLSSSELRVLLEYVEKIMSQGKTTEEFWKVYRLYNYAQNLTFVEFKHYRRPEVDSGITSPDYYFTDELIQLSKLENKEIFYLWSQHADEGYEVYKQGQCINSVISDTHGPAVTVNGKGVRIPEKTSFLGIVTKYDTGKVIGEHSLIPKEIRDYAVYNKLPSEYITFVHKEIPDFKSLYDKLK
jgi:hypothetical protein